MNKAKLSVIVPVYNVEKYIHRCIDSIISQTYADMEIILVDDGSTDKSGKICEEYKQKDNRVVVLHKENGGQSTARNVALDIAKGDYLAFVDSDDYIEKDMFSAMMSEFAISDVDIVVCGYKVINERSGTEEVMADATGLYPGYVIARDILVDKFPKSFAWNKLFKKHLFDNIRFPENRIYEDIAVSYKLFDLAGTVKIIKPTYYHYFIGRPGNTTSELSSSKAIKSYYNAFLNCYEQYNFIKSNSKYDDLSPAMENSMRQMAYQTLVLSVYFGKEKYEYYLEDIRRKYSLIGKKIPDYIDSSFYLRNRIICRIKKLAKRIIYGI